VDRSRVIETFLDDAGWRGAERRHLAGDASFRRYERIHLAGQTAVLMDAPPPQDDVGPFIAMTNHLRGLGYSAPALLHEDTENGFLLLEDLGDGTFTNALAAGADETALYEAATDVLIDLHRRAAGDAIPAGLAPYDETKLLDEALLLTDWYLPRATGRDTPAEVRSAYEDIWRSALNMLNDISPTLVLRDFHADNLLWLPDRAGVTACGLLDYQDAVAGPPAYDLMSLLEDARRDSTPGLAEKMIDRYLAALPDVDRDTFMTGYKILAAQRHCKVIGIFTRLLVRDDKPDYLAHIPRVWRLLDAACTLPELAPLANWIRAYAPADKQQLLRELEPA
jgi:aminoglycoside/choline kinase family phosphotransferase